MLCECSVSALRMLYERAVSALWVPRRNSQVPECVEFEESAPFSYTIGSETAKGVV